MPGTPVVSVVLCVHNDERFLPEAVQSILTQSFTDFELIAIDDGSTDSSGRYLDSLTDPRIRVIHNNRNIGLTASLNIGLSESRGRYIARMDSDDVSKPDRLQRQVEFLDANPDIGILGTSRQAIDEKGDIHHFAAATTGDIPIRWKCLLGNPFAHPTVMLRKSLLDQHQLRYDESFRTAQDYELWTRLLRHTRGENLAEPLLRYRLRDGTGRTSKPEQLGNHDRIALAACQRLLPGLTLTLEEIRQLRGRYGGLSVREAEMNPAHEQWIQLRLKMLNEFVAASGIRCGPQWAMNEREAILSASSVPISATALEYRDLRKDRPEREREAAIAIGSAVLSAATIFGLVAVWLVANLNLIPSKPQPVTWMFPGGLAVVALTIWSWQLYTKRESRPFVLGAFIGFGAALLIEGACFIATSR